MPLYDFACDGCGHVFESFAAVEDRSRRCGICGSTAKRVLSVGASAYRHDATWLESVREVVDKESRLPHTRAFLETPTRENYSRWMRENRIRPMDDGEYKHSTPKENEEAHVRRMTDRIMKQKRKREAIELYSSSR